MLQTDHCCLLLLIGPYTVVTEAIVMAFCTHEALFVVGDPGSQCEAYLPLTKVPCSIEKPRPAL